MSNWNRKYRPKTLAELHLQTVKEQFQTFLKAGTLPQVFIFTGPKGTGKTSTARILGALVNNPVNEAQVRTIFFNKTSSTKPLIDAELVDQALENIYQGNSFIVQELDAASNRGIDDIRALKERAALPPAVGLVSVFILDEAHMLTSEAFNALLKILEEPPAHALFILATTELHKIPETITSRAQMIQFKKASDSEIAAALENVLKQEKITFETEAVSQIARQADGSFRDAIKSLESVARTGPVTVERLQSIGFNSYEQQIETLIGYILKKDVAGVITIFYQAREQRVQEQYFHAMLLSQLHRSLEQAVGLKEGDPVAPLEASKFLLTELSQPVLSEISVLPLLQLEMKIIDIITRSKKKANPVEQETPPKQVQRAPAKHLPEASQSATPLEETQQATVVTPVTSSNVELELPTYAGAADGAVLVTQWSDFVERMASKNATVAALLRSAHPIEGSTGHVTVKVFYKFHQEQLRSTKFNQMIRACAEEMLEGSIEFNFTVEEPILSTELTDVHDMSELSSVAAQALL